MRRVGGLCVQHLSNLPAQMCSVRPGAEPHDKEPVPLSPKYVSLKKTTLCPDKRAGAEKKKGRKQIMHISMLRNLITKEQKKSKVDCLKTINKIGTLPAKLIKGGGGESTYIRNKNVDILQVL